MISGAASTTKSCSLQRDLATESVSAPAQTAASAAVSFFFFFYIPSLPRSRQSFEFHGHSVGGHLNILFLVTYFMTGSFLHLSYALHDAPIPPRFGRQNVLFTIFFKQCLLVRIKYIQIISDHVLKWQTMRVEMLFTPPLTSNK